MARLTRYQALLIGGGYGGSGKGGSVEAATMIVIGVLLLAISLAVRP